MKKIIQTLSIVMVILASTSYFDVNVKAEETDAYRLATVQVYKTNTKRVSMEDGYCIIQGIMSGVAYLDSNRNLKSHDVSFSFNNMDGSRYQAESFSVQSVSYNDYSNGFTATVNVSYNLRNVATNTIVGNYYFTMTFTY